MSVIVVGLNHRTSPVEILERVTVPRDDLHRCLHDLAKREHVAEVVVLSTCNRTEIYARSTKFHPAIAEVTEFLAEHAGVSPSDLADVIYTFHEDAAVTHLFGVASGIDSMILGEGEILGQVRGAWLEAEEAGTVRTPLSHLFRHAVQVGKRARSQTAIARGSVSIASAAVWLATQRLGTLEGRKIVVLGAGKMGEGMAVALAGSGTAHVVVANRSETRASELAARIGGEPVALERLPEVLADADVLLASTGAGEIMITRGQLEEVMAGRPGRPLLVVDIAVPRDVDPDAARVPAVTLLDIDDLKTFVQESMEERRGEIDNVRVIIGEEVDRYRADSSAREVAPLVAALHARGEEVRAAELERFAARLRDLDPATRDAVESLTRGIVNKLLHDPTVRVKAAAAESDDDSLADALAALFDL
ncbi:MAG TPA: glutamyl-tRNA reductase [Acidimicrobiia bacterium]|nr:glutamyl-tRNA reductase [Acidimicrobiia bacterium]